ncbi:carbohydrate ABC transporter permease [Lederbergia wuyishanensis]|uniref:ABC-type glycerol-3-phosphate transport system permease component n=1 Tax=Lederbergia wuyishanensis TaxID=1347903 RepID=A0ABU0D978_9BACI|nr:carbohydrate ABC transporter permease [Lederbergia wuyishanensis]MCJ8009412.1 carbohydrate ABC transporter permease [Lederbergia wuyishanensis]MDQ0344979.1 ABC-type glycerol-3-phosphate transport system permease component [Lederbergia wuyishanensis]
MKKLGVGIKNFGRETIWKLKNFGGEIRRLDRTQYSILFFLSILAIFMLLPIVYIFNHAFKPLHELFLFPPTFIVQNPTTQNFVELLSLTQSTFVPVSRYIFNSVIVTVLATAAMVITSALCAYALSKHPFPGAKLVFSTIMISLLFVPQVLQIPRYVVVQNLGIMNSYWGHVLPMIAMPVGVFLMKQFMDQVPNEILEAAKIDGASEFGMFLRIVMPVVTPAIATIAIISFQSAWGNVETSQLFMQDESMKTLPYYMTSLTANLANTVARQGAAAAGALILFLPQLIIFLFFQSKVIATMAHSGIK